MYIRELLMSKYIDILFKKLTLFKIILYQWVWPTTFSEIAFLNYTIFHLRDLNLETLFKKF